MNKGNIEGAKAKTVFDLLSDGFKGESGILGVLNLGETKIPINQVEIRILSRAIYNKDYYEIKRIVKHMQKK